jgi:hypothetical protein
MMSDQHCVEQHESRLVIAMRGDVPLLRKPGAERQACDQQHFEREVEVGNQGGFPENARRRPQARRFDPEDRGGHAPDQQPSDNETEALDA